MNHVLVNSSANFLVSKLKLVKLILLGIMPNDIRVGYFSTDILMLKIGRERTKINFILGRESIL